MTSAYHASRGSKGASRLADFSAVVKHEPRGSKPRRSSRAARHAVRLRPRARPRQALAGRRQALRDRRQSARSWRSRPAARRRPRAAARSSRTVSSFPAAAPASPGCASPPQSGHSRRGPAWIEGGRLELVLPADDRPQRSRPAWSRRRSRLGRTRLERRVAYAGNAVSPDDFEHVVLPAGFAPVGELGARLRSRARHCRSAARCAGADGSCSARRRRGRDARRKSRSRRDHRGAASRTSSPIDAELDPAPTAPTG